MTTEGIMTSKKTQDIHGKPQETAQVAQQKPEEVTSWPPLTRIQRKNRSRVDRLIDQWPELFSRETPKPLKAGIAEDLIQDVAARGLAFGSGVLRAAVMSYIRCPRYYLALMAGGVRYDLKGQPCGEVTPREQQEAEKRLMMLQRGKRKQRKGNEKKKQNRTQGQQS